MVLAPRIMRGEVENLPPKHAIARGTASNAEKRTEADLHKLQHNLTGNDGMGEKIICDQLHGIPGFTERATRDYLAILKDTGAYARTISEIAET